LLLGPSLFELWFERYLDFTVESLYFCEIPFQSPFVNLPPSSFVSLPHAAAALAGHVRHPRHLSTVLHRATCPCPIPRWPPLPSPRRTCHLPEPRFTAARRRCNPAPPPAFRRPHVSLSGRPSSQLSPLSSFLHATLPPPLPEPRRGRHARRRLSALAPARPRLSLDSEHLLELLACLLLHLHTLFSLNFSCSNHHTSPDIIRGFGSPSAAPTAAPHPRSKAPTAPP
jgi:hypothetical protein